MTQITWTPAELFAAANQITRQRVIAQILDGHLNGVMRDSAWYVLDFAEEDPGADAGSRNGGLQRQLTSCSRLN